MPSLRGVVVFAALAIAGPQIIQAEEAAKAEPAKVSYFRDVRPIFQEQCQGCHQPAKPGGDYVMTSFEHLLRGGESELPAVTPGDASDSMLLTLITPLDGKADMPKGKPPLSESQIALVERWIAEGAVDDTPASERPVIDAAHPPVYKSLPILTAMAYSPDGQLLAVSGYHEVLLHKADGSELIGRLVGLSERIESIAFSPDGKRLAVAGGSPGRLGEIQVWDLEKRSLVLSAPVSYDTVYGVSWSGDGTKVAFGCADNSVRAIDAATGEQVLHQGAHSDWVLDTAFSTDSSHLISVSRDRSMKLIEVATQRFVDNITSITPGALKGGLLALDRHPTKDEVAVGGADGTPKIFRIYRDPGKARQIGDDFNLIRNLEAMPGRIFTVAYSPDGTRVAAGTSNDGTGQVRIYNEADGALQVTFADNCGPIYEVAFSPDGATLAASGYLGHVFLIDAATGSLKHKFIPVPSDQLAGGTK